MPPLSGPFRDPKSGHRPLSIETTVVDSHAAVVSVHGELDLWSAPELKRTLCDLLAAGRKQVIVDAAGVQFMDSTALGVLVAIDRRLAADEQLVIARPGPEVLRVLELSGVAAGVRIFPTLEDAVTATGHDAHQPSQEVTAPLTADAALLLGIASTAMPFAQSVEEQGERWLRALRRHGEAGALLASLGVQEGPVSRLEEDDAVAIPREADPVAIVTGHAMQVAVARGAGKVTTTDVLVAVRDVYGKTFTRVLAAHGVSAGELAERLSMTTRATTEAAP